VQCTQQGYSRTDEADSNVILQHSLHGIAGGEPDVGCEGLILHAHLVVNARNLLHHFG